MIKKKEELKKMILQPKNTTAMTTKPQICNTPKNGCSFSIADILNFNNESEEQYRSVTPISTRDEIEENAKFNATKAKFQSNLNCASSQSSSFSNNIVEENLPSKKLERDANKEFEEKSCQETKMTINDHLNNIFPTDSTRPNLFFQTPVISARSYLG